MSPASSNDNEASKVSPGHIDALLEDAFNEMKLGKEDSLQESKGGSGLGDQQNLMEATSLELPAKIDTTIDRLLKMSEFKEDTTLENMELEDIDKLVEQLMVDLTDKELLAEPFAELASTYPKWLAENRDKLEDNVLSQYQSQCEIVLQINSIFSENNWDSRQKEVFELMQKMQEHGSPPEEMLSKLGMGPASHPVGSDCIQM